MVFVTIFSPSSALVVYDGLVMNKMSDNLNNNPEGEAEGGGA